MVVGQGSYKQKTLSVTRNVVVYEGWSLVRVVVRQGFYCSVVVSTSAWHAAGLHWRLFISVSFGGDTKSRRSLLSAIWCLCQGPGQGSRGSKISHTATGGKHTDLLSWTPHDSLEKDNSLKHSCVSPKMGCLEYT